MVEKYFDKSEKPEHFCSINCLKSYIAKQSTPATTTVSTGTGSGLVIQSVSSLAGAGQPGPRPDTLPTEPLPPGQLPQAPAPPPKVITKTVMETVVKAPPTVEVKNKQVSAKPFMATKGVSCRPHPCHKATQTDIPSTPALLPVMVPVYMPMPMQMYAQPYPVPVPVPIPIPVPIFIPTTRNSTRGIQKSLKKLKAKMPEDPFEAELLALAGAVAGNDTAALDSDDSLPQDDLDDIDAVVNESLGVEKRSHHRSTGHVQPVPAPDLEHEMSATNVVPKPLPQVTPDAVTSPPPTSYPSKNARSSGGHGHQKRRHSGRDGKSFFALNTFTNKL